MTPEQKKLVEENHSLIYWFMSKHHLSMDYYGDLAVGLCMAAINFDPSLGVKFSTYAVKALYTHCIQEIKSDWKRSCEISLCEPLGTDSKLTLMDTLEDETAEEKLESIASVQWLLDALPLFDLKIVLYKLKGMPMREIGKALECSHQTVMNHLQIIRNAVEKNKTDRRWKVEDSDERGAIIDEIYSLIY